MTDTRQEYAEARCPDLAGDCLYADELEQLRTTVNVLSELVITDELTGLNNFRHFMYSLDVEMERTRRSGKPVSLVIVDIDDFKRTNDELGHEFGNQVLVMVANVLKGALRKLDVPCRYGGEEFVIILPDTSLSSAAALAGRLREAVAATSTLSDDGPVTVTVSCGVDVFSLNDTRSAREFIDAADRQLLKAKADGKNRVCAPADSALDTAVTPEERGALFGDDSQD